VTLAAVALALDTGALADQAGEARNDLAGTFFLLAGDRDRRQRVVRAQRQTGRAADWVSAAAP
jgi:hypothetical protein